MPRRLAGIALGTMLIVGTTACTSGPKLSEDGPRFQQAAQTMLDTIVERRGAEGSQPTVKQDGRTDVGCGDGKAKRVFEASLPVRASADPDNTLDGTVDTVLANSPGYSIKTQPDSDDLSRRELVIRADDYAATITAVVTIAPVPTLALTGETDCLATG